MSVFKKILAVYSGAVSVIVAVYFLLTLFLTDSSTLLAYLNDLNVFTFFTKGHAGELGVWLMIDALMALAIIIALAVNVTRKRRLRVGAPDEPVTREYLEVNVSFYATILLALWFFWNWFYALYPENEPETVALIHLEWWAWIDPMTAIIAGATAFYLWRDSQKAR